MQGVASLKTVHGKTYRVGTCQSLLEYTASGSSLDWALAVGKIPYSFGMELRPDRPDNLIQHILNYFIPYSLGKELRPDRPDNLIQHILNYFIPYSLGKELRPDRPDNLIQHILNYFIPGFILPAKEIIPTGEETWAFHKVAAEMIINEFAP